MNNGFELTISKIRGRYYVTAGKSKLSRGFLSHESAASDMGKHAELYEFWAGSAGVSAENATAKTVICAE